MIAAGQEIEFIAKVAVAIVEITVHCQLSHCDEEDDSHSARQEAVVADGHTDSRDLRDSNNRAGHSTREGYRKSASDVIGGCGKESICRPQRLKAHRKACSLR